MGIDENVLNYKKNSIEIKVKKILSNRLGIELDEIKPTSSFRNDLGIDSFDSLRLIFEIEDEFNITVPEKEILNINNVEDVVNYISNRMRIHKSTK